MNQHVPGFVTVGDALASALEAIASPQPPFIGAPMSPLTWRRYTQAFAIPNMFSVLAVGVPLGLTKRDDVRKAVGRFLHGPNPRPLPDRRDRDMVCHHERALLATLYVRNAAAIIGMMLIGRPAR